MSYTPKEENELYHMSTVNVTGLQMALAKANK
jgi:hypothetical protein